MMLGSVWADDQFETSEIHLEKNLTDGDAEVVINASADDEGLSRLTIAGPDGRLLLDLNAPNSKLGLRKILVESPEPENDGQILADYPAGEYRFSGTTTSGEAISAAARLGHDFPSSVSLVQPNDGQKGVAIAGLTFEWTPAKGARHYILILEDQELDLEMEVELPGDTLSFKAPEGFLHPDREYKLAVGAVAEDGNRSFVEISFATTREE
ncbi:MAG TPA: hypothetical protein DDY14_14710 [Chromatiaceae bacterium]|nr:MAG: hypothetical protein N838_13020 [Thiohalocapsa sp. PB-PSB1]HBG96533.1 hypothetical protein [Chromatiaceae bacterium]HCS89895.1 hypothetical protein [Chromatiaceae bacterium]